MKRVLVTGGPGFIGRLCLPRLQAAGFEVHAVSSGKNKHADPGATWHVADLLDLKAIPSLVRAVQPTHLLHLAWCTEPGKYWTSPDNARWVAASIELALEFRQQGGRRAVFAGSCAEYDWRYGFCSEGTTPVVPKTFYGRSKVSLLQVVGDLTVPGSFTVAWGRLFFLYGPGERPERVVPSVIRSLLAGEPARCTAGDQIRDFLYAEDAADAFVTLLDSNLEGAVNIASGQPLRVRDLVSRIGEKLNRSDLLQLGVLPIAVDEPPLLVADVRKLAGTGFRPAIDLDAGLDRSIAWWNERQ